MTTRNNRLYANNARTTLVTGVTTSSTSIVVASATGFPVPTGTDFFNITLDDLVHVEIVKVTAVSGSTFTCVRAQEGTTAFAFTSGAKIEMRLTSAAITSFARSTEKLADYTSVDNLPTPSLSDGNSGLCANGDSFGVPVVAVTAGTKWRFTNYPSTVRTSTAGASATTTSIALTGASTLLTDATARAYIIQFTSGAYSGLCRVATILTNSITWATALAGAPSSGDNYEIYWGGTAVVDLSPYAPKASPTFTGTVSGITKSMVGLSNADNTSDVNKPVSTAQQNALNLKADLSSPTFTGTVIAPTVTPSSDSTTKVATTAFVHAVMYVPVFCLSVPGSTVRVETGVAFSVQVATALVYGGFSMSVLSGALPSGVSVVPWGMSIYVNGTVSTDSTTSSVIRVTNTTLSQQADLSLTIIATTTPPADADSAGEDGGSGDDGV